MDDDRVSRVSYFTNYEHRFEPDIKQLKKRMDENIK
jgi:hypothetical protein